MHIRLATRKSSLALAQSRWVAARLAELGAAKVELVEMVTLGDRMQNVALAEIGGKGLFVSELEQAILENRADLAVHSLKDVPAELAPGLVLGCVPEREDPRDVIVTTDGGELDALSAGERVGTSSLRRSIQLKRMRNDLEYALLRGNVDTRLGKLEAGQYRAIVLAYAGLRRLGLADRPLWPIPVTLSVPAVGQGALAIECRADDVPLRELLARLEHASSRACVDAERKFLRALGGDCHTPVAGHARLEENGARLRFEGLVASPDGKRMIRSAAERYLPVDGRIPEVALTLAGEVADALLEQGGAELVREALASKQAQQDPRRKPS
jgi:hydroxymethylbilane synthase